MYLSHCLLLLKMKIIIILLNYVKCKISSSCCTSSSYTCRDLFLCLKNAVVVVVGFTLKPFFLPNISGTPSVVPDFSSKRDTNPVVSQTKESQTSLKNQRRQTKYGILRVYTPGINWFKLASTVTWQVILVPTKINFASSILTECTYS